MRKLTLTAMIFGLVLPVVAGAQDVPVTQLPLPRFVSLKAKEGNVRRGPNPSYRIDWVYKWRGMPLKIIAEYEHWRRIEDADGFSGWIHYSLLSGIRSAMISADETTAHRRPDAQSDVFFQAKRGAIVKLLSCQDLWCRIEAAGEKAWVLRKDIWGTLPDENF